MLKIKELSKAARLVHLFPDLKGSLLSFGPLCDDGCIIVLDKSTVKITKNGKLILAGTRSGSNQLWYMDLDSDTSSPSDATANSLSIK
jgi:hypothetical protein